MLLDSLRESLLDKAEGTARDREPKPAMRCVLSATEGVKGVRCWTTVVSEA